MNVDMSKYPLQSQILDPETAKIIEEATEKIKKLPYKLDATLYFKPIEELKKLYDEQRWFEGLVISCAYFERIAVSKLREYAEYNKKLPISSKKIKKMNLTLDKLLVLSLISEIIDNKTYNDMDKIRILRNDLVHNPDKIKELDTDPERTKKLFQNSIRCIDKIRKKKFPKT